MTSIAPVRSPNAITSTVALSRLRRLAADGTTRQVREDNLLSLTDVASALGITKATLSKWERGLQTPRGEPARRYAELLAALTDEMPPGQEASRKTCTTASEARRNAKP